MPLTDHEEFKNITESLDDLDLSEGEALLAFLRDIADDPTRLQEWWQAHDETVRRLFGDGAIFEGSPLSASYITCATLSIQLIAHPDSWEELYGLMLEDPHGETLGTILSCSPTTYDPDLTWPKLRNYLEAHATLILLLETA